MACGKVTVKHYGDPVLVVGIFPEVLEANA